MRRVILNADDLGYDPGVTRGIIEAMRNGVVSSTTFMVNTPYTDDAAAQVEGLAVGLHLNLARWNSISRPTYTFVESDAAKLEALFVEDETHAQLERLAQLLGRPATHLDVHKHLHRLPNVVTGVIAAAKARRLPVRSPDSAVRGALQAAGVPTNDVMLGDAGADAYWTPEVFEHAIAFIPEDGVIELMCHPGYRPERVTSGYGAQREVELATFVSPAAKAALAKHRLTLTSWR